MLTIVLVVCFVFDCVRLCLGLVFVWGLFCLVFYCFVGLIGDLTCVVLLTCFFCCFYYWTFKLFSVVNVLLCLQGDGLLLRLLC